MKNYNIVNKLQKEGYNIIYKKWGYWDNIPHVQLDGFEFTIAEIKYNGSWQSCRVDFIYNHVQEALHIAKNNNPILLKKIQEVPCQEWFYRQYLILNMGDYYQYKNKKYHFNDYYKVLEKLKKEI